MKSIIIVGPSRAGKTTLAKRLHKELGYFVLSLDKLVAAFHAAYPQLNIRLNWNRDKTTENIAPFIGHFLGLFSSGEGIKHELNLRAHDLDGNGFVLEGGYFDFEKIAAILNEYGANELKDRFILIGLVQNKKTADEYVRDFKKYDTEDDWTYGFSEGELRDYVEQDAIPFNRAMTDCLTQYGFSVYDTSSERNQVFDKIIESIAIQNGMKTDKFSYHLGAADCFCEMVRAGTKRIALSHPCDSQEERDSFLPEFDKLCEKYGVHYYAEDEAFLTDLFPLSLNQGKFNVIFYQDESALQEYLTLKADKEKAMAEGNYSVCRGTIARRYGKLLSYTDEGIQRLLDSNSEKE